MKLEVKAKKGKWLCPFCGSEWDATDGYASWYNFDSHIKDHRRRNDKPREQTT